MDLQGVREALRGERFVPVTVRLANGRDLRVPHPEFAAVAPPLRIIVTSEDGSWKVLDRMQIVSLDFEGEAVPASKRDGSK